MLSVVAKRFPAPELEPGELLTSYTRVTPLIVIILTLVLTACGGERSSVDDLPPIPPTITPVPTSTPAPPSTPVNLDGELLEPLEDGQEIVPDDQRYSIVLPEFWVSGVAPGADIAYRESGGTPEDSEYAFNVMRERLPASIADAEAYAESGRNSVEESFENVETISMEPVQVGDAQGMRWIYEMTVTVDPVLVHQVYIVDGSTGFLLTGSAPADGDRDAAIDVFSAITGSFTLPRG